MIAYLYALAIVVNTVSMPASAAAIHERWASDFVSFVPKYPTIPLQQRRLSSHKSQPPISEDSAWSTCYGTASASSITCSFPPPVQTWSLFPQVKALERQRYCSLRCLNGGVCDVDNNGEEHCTCSDAYEGTLCELQRDHCQSNPCGVGGTCVSLVGGYVCTCTKEYSGRNCEKGATVKIYRSRV